MTNDRLITLLYNSIICLEEFGIKGEKLEFEIGISEDEYKKVMEENMRKSYEILLSERTSKVTLRRI